MRLIAASVFIIVYTCLDRKSVVDIKNMFEMNKQRNKSKVMLNLYNIDCNSYVN